MNIIIAGCGKLGLNIAKQLIKENEHEITLIDKNKEKIGVIQGQLDVRAIHGDATGYQTQKEAGIEEADLLIATLDRDEISLLSCLIAKRAGDCQTIARVRDTGFYQEIRFIKEELGLSMAVNPERAVAAEITKLIQIPSAMEVDSFANGRVNMIRYQIPRICTINGMKLMELSRKIDVPMLICVVERNGEIIIPHGDFVLCEDDMIAFTTSFKDSDKIFEHLQPKNKPIKHVMIVGGGRIAYYLTSILQKVKMKVKIIEIDRARCEMLSEAFPEAIIIHGDAADKDLLLEEGIRDTDAFVTLTGLDEENIMLSLYANKVSNARRITKINKILFDEVIDELPLGAVVSSKYITSERILQHIRAMQNSQGSNVETLYRLFDERVEALEFIVRENERTKNLLERPIMELNLKKNLLICTIYRQGKVIIPSGQDVLKAGDSVVIVTTTMGLEDISEILAE